MDISKILKQQSAMNKEDDEDFSMMDIDDQTEKIPATTTKIVKDFEKEMKINLSEEERAFAALMPAGSEEQPAVSHMQRLRQDLLEARQDVLTEVESVLGSTGNKQMIAALNAAGDILADYTSRHEKIPRIVADIAMSKGWLRKLYHTCPEKWSAAAMFRMTRVFTAAQKNIAEEFAAKVLLPRCRDDISYYKRLNQHLYRALRQLLKKPTAFFGGIVMPLCQSGDCTLREAIVFSSVLVRHHAPTAAASGAILRLAELQYSGATSIFLRVLLNKRYSLQYSVIDAVVGHFLTFKQDTRDLPTLWHQALLTLAERYKSCLTLQQKEDLKSLAAYHSHHLITKEVHLQLDSSACRPPVKPPKPSTGGLVL